MTIELKSRSFFAALALAFVMTLSGPMHTQAIADGIVASDEDDDDDDNGNSEDHANERANERATGDEEECGSTIENSRC